MFRHWTDNPIISVSTCYYDILRPWQQELWDILQTQPCANDIISVYDKQGTPGKTWMAEYIRSRMKEVNVIKRIEHADFIDAYADESYAVFDYTGERIEHLNYKFIRKFKEDYQHVHVVVFSNDSII